MSESLDERLREIIDARASRTQPLKDRISSWERAIGGLNALARSLDALSVHPGATDAPREARDALVRADLCGRIEREILPRLRRVEQRFSRRTINIGVSGEARVGKSTLLQAISGLGEGQIPTGDDLPVTAVRSRIYHSPGVERATLRFHTWESFRTGVLQPYYDRLGWSVAPASAAAFRSASLPAIREGQDGAEIRKGLRDRVSGMQRSLDSYLPLLTGLTTAVALDELRPLVAYPTATEENDTETIPSRRYLAVREAAIECPFPGIDVRDLGLIDLPGTGEIVAAGEDRHVAGLEDEVDLVLLVTNPKKKAYWGAEAARTLDLVKQARCGASPQDFCMLVINEGGSSEGQRVALRGDIERKTKDGGHSRPYTVLECDAIAADNVRSHLMQPVLSHLAERLAEMDEAALRYTETDVSVLVADIEGALSDIERALREGIPAAAPSQVVLVRLTRELRREVAYQLATLVEQRRALARGPALGDPGFEESIERIYERVREWLRDGLGRGEAVWLAEAERTLKLNKGSGELIDDEMNRIRVHIAGEFTRLDDHLAAAVVGLWNEIAGVVGPQLGVPVSAGIATLQQLSRHLADAGGVRMAAAIDDLLGVRLDYRTHFHPRLRRQLDMLHPQISSPGSLERPRITVAPTAEGATEALRLLVEHGERASYEAQKVLLRELELPKLVLHAAAEQFDDGFVRAGDASDEFLRYALARRDAIWPNRFDQIDQAHQLFADCRDRLAAARGIVATLEPLGFDKTLSQTSAVMPLRRLHSAASGGER